MFILTMKYKNSQEARRPPPATPTPPALPGTHPLPVWPSPSVPAVYSFCLASEVGCVSITA